MEKSRRPPSPLWHQDHCCRPLSIFGVPPLLVTDVSSLGFQEVLPTPIPQTGSLVTSWCLTKSEAQASLSVNVPFPDSPTQILLRTFAVCQLLGVLGIQEGTEEGLPVKTGGAKMNVQERGMERLLPNEGRGRRPETVPGLSMAGGVWPDIRPYG